MVTPTRTWIFNLNIVPTQSTATLQYQDSLLRVKQFLCGQNPVNASGAWTVRGSSNSVVANASDNWNADADIVAAAAGVAHSWIVLRSPTGFPSPGRFIELMLSCDVSANTETLRLVWANGSFPFDLSAPSITASPTNPTNALENTNATDRQILENTPGLNNHTLSMWRTTFGDFIIAFSQDGNGIIDTAWACFGLTGGEAVDPWPCAINVARFLSGAGAFQKETNWNGTTGSMGWWIDNTTTTTDMQLATPKLASNTEVMSLMPGGGTAISGIYPVFPLDYYANQGAARCGYRGRMPDLGLCVGSPSSNTFEPGSDPIRRIVVGEFWLLSNGPSISL